jgi:hypothetical protein
MTFDKTSTWPIGYFRACTSWLLNNRRDIPKRISVINAELKRIGTITVTYRTVQQEGNTIATEERTGLAVTHGSSLGRLVQAYIAQGGNPLDISSFAYTTGTYVPEVDLDGNATVQEKYPHGGVVAPISVNYNDPVPTPVDKDNPQASDDKDTGFGTYQGGYLRTDRYYPARQGGKMSRGGTDANIVTKTFNQIRSWANQDIKERLQDIEWRIIKLCDLSEQLTKERDEILVQALGGGSTDTVDKLDPERFNPGLQIQVLIQDMNKILFDVDEKGAVPSYGQPNENLNYLGFTFEDVPSEATRDAMGG